MGLNVETVSTQISPRDRHAMFFSTLAIIAGSIERISTEIRHLQRTEVMEVEEKFTEGQKGSSAMPHKRNPVLTENLSGLSRVVRSAVIPALENITLWHERDISHSSVERFIGPDTTITIDFALNRLTSVIKDLVLYPENMLKNLNQTNGLYFSQSILLALTQVGMERENAYALVQKIAMQAWEKNEDFKKHILENKEIKGILTKAKIESIFDIKKQLRNVEYIFDRVF